MGVWTRRGTLVVGTALGCVVVSSLTWYLLRRRGSASAKESMTEDAASTATATSSTASTTTATAASATAASATAASAAAHASSTEHAGPASIRRNGGSEADASSVQSESPGYYFGRGVARQLGSGPRPAGPRLEPEGSESKLKDESGLAWCDGPRAFKGAVLFCPDTYEDGQAAEGNASEVRDALVAHMGVSEDAVTVCDTKSRQIHIVSAIQSALARARAEAIKNMRRSIVWVWISGRAFSSWDEDGAAEFSLKLYSNRGGALTEKDIIDAIQPGRMCQERWTTGPQTTAFRVHTSSHSFLSKHPRPSTENIKRMSHPAQLVDVILHYRGPDADTSTLDPATADLVIGNKPSKCSIDAHVRKLATKLSDPHAYGGYHDDLPEYVPAGIGIKGNTLQFQVSFDLVVLLPGGEGDKSMNLRLVPYNATYAQVQAAIACLRAIEFELGIKTQARNPAESAPTAQLRTTLPALADVIDGRPIPCPLPSGTHIVSSCTNIGPQVGAV